MSKLWALIAMDCDETSFVKPLRSPRDGPRSVCIIFQLSILVYYAAVTPISYADPL